ncbi:hypothetical protein OG470_24420 [Micromonospora sp. NBC_00389]|uniref:hypothetical protein n=1 Tax=Micromonospora sp. NBC_00389 TaxID=2903586 RepID=UPI002E1E98FB
MSVIEALAVTCRPPVPNSLPHSVGRASATGVARRGDFRNSGGSSPKADVGMVTGVLALGDGWPTWPVAAGAVDGGAVDGAGSVRSSPTVQAVVSATVPSNGRVSASSLRALAVGSGV